MTKPELITLFAERTGYTKKEVESTLLPALEKVLTEDIPKVASESENKKANIRGLCTFELKVRKGRKGVNNLTGKPYDNTGKTKRVLTFKMELQ